MSVIQDYWRVQEQQKPLPWNTETWRDYSEVLRLLKKLDERLGQPDCEDPAKAAWMREVEKRLAELEKQGS